MLEERHNIILQRCGPACRPLRRLAGRNLQLRTNSYSKTHGQILNTLLIRSIVKPLFSRRQQRRQQHP